ncbi:transglutaminase-like domain-containing protein [Parasalinivibrio latis]|uniref:transglutaminase-like domain-containing protein n=1 Tax=Parasalinivibrio latis TaxID=2952610 RepID=UPI0030E29C6F
MEWKLSFSKEDASLIEKYRPHVSTVNEYEIVLIENRFEIEQDKVVVYTTEVGYFPRYIDTEGQGSHSIYFNRHSDSITVLSAASVDTQGTVEQLLPASASIRTTDRYNTFTEQRELVLPIPSLKEGSFALLRYKTETYLKHQEMDWSETLYTVSSAPINEYRLTAKWRDGIPVRWKSNSDTVSCEEENRELQCTGSDIVSFKSDSNIFWRDHVGQIVLGGEKDWPSVIHRATTAMNTAISNTQGLDAIMSSLIHPKDSEQEKIAKILDFVSRDIRYVSLSGAGHAVTPHSIAHTLNVRYGDCKDKSVLLRAMLKEIGINANLVLVSTNRTAEQQLLLPTMAAFNHVVVCFKRSGNDYCLDPTDTETNWQFTPQWIQGKVSLPLEPGYIPHTVDNSEFRWQFENKSSIRFKEDGGQHETISRTYFGEYASYYRSRLNHLSDEELTDFLSEEYSDAVTTISTPVFKVENVEEMAASLNINSSAVLEPFLEINKNLRYEEADAWIKKELYESKLSNSHYAEQFGGLRIVSEYEFDLNNIWSLRYPPAEVTLYHDFGSLVRTVDTLANGTVEIRTEVRIPSQTVSSQQIEPFNHLLDLFARESLISFWGNKVE